MFFSSIFFCFCKGNWLFLCHRENPHFLPTLHKRCMKKQEKNEHSTTFHWGCKLINLLYTNPVPPFAASYFKPIQDSCAINRIKQSLIALILSHLIATLLYGGFLLWALATTMKKGNDGVFTSRNSRWLIEVELIEVLPGDRFVFFSFLTRSSREWESKNPFFANAMLF